VKTKERVLVVDDEKRICDSIRLLLQRQDYEVFVAYNGEAALNLLRKESIDLIITDLMMPKVDGFALLEQVKKSYPHTLVIVITGYSSMRSSIEALRNGAYDYLVKPFDLDILNLSVEKALDKIRLRRMHDDFISMMTHDLKNPLTSIIGYCSLLVGGVYGELSPVFAAPLTGVQDNADRMLALINDFLAVNRISSEGVRLDRKLHSLNTLAAHLLEGQHAQAEIRKIHLNLALDSKLPVIAYDAMQIERVIGNLLSNALKFTPLGGSITVSTGIANDEIFLRVTDTGSGIPADQQANIFERYKRIESKTEGTGLGLYICKTIITAHGGRVTVDSKVGRGSTFTFYLPIEE